MSDIDWQALIAPENMHKNGGIGRQIKVALREDNIESVNALLDKLRAADSDPRLVVIGRVKDFRGILHPVVLEVGG